MKHRQVDRLFAMITAVCLVVSLLPAAALALEDGPSPAPVTLSDVDASDNRIPGQTEGTITTEEALKTAVENAEEYATITLEGNIELANTLTISGGKFLSLDLGDHTLTGPASGVISVENSSLEIGGTGTISNQASDDSTSGTVISVSGSYGTEDYTCNSEVVLSNSVRIVDNTSGAAISVEAPACASLFGEASVESAGGTAFKVSAAGEVLISGGTVSGQQAVSIDGTGAKVSFTDGAITATGDATIVGTKDGNDITVYGGTFNQGDLADYCDDEHALTGDDTNGWTVTELPKAVNVTMSYGDTYKFASLRTAINTADAGSTITLLDNYTVTTPANSEYNLPAGATLDLNSHILTVPYMTAIFQGEHITIQNGSITSVTGTGQASYALWIGNGSKDTSATVQNVTVTGGINVFDAQATLKNVTVTGHDYYAVWADINADVTIESGAYKTNGNKGLVGACISENVEEDGPSGELTISGGEFTVKDEKFAPAGDDNITISGGRFNAEVPIEYCAESYIPVAVADEAGKYTVGGPYAAAIVKEDGSYEGYETLAEAVEAVAEEGGTVQLLADETVTGVPIEIERALTLDLNGHTVSSTADVNEDDSIFYVTAGGNLTITDTSEAKDGKVVSDPIQTGCYAVCVEDAELTLLAGTLESKLGAAVYVIGAMELRGGTVIGAGDPEGYPDIYSSVGCAIYVDDAKFTATGGTVTCKTGYAVYVNAAYDTPVSEISGGTFTGADKYDALMVDAGSASVSGGSFSSQVKPEHCADGFAPVSNGDGTYGVTTRDNCVASIKSGDQTEYYPTLAAAVADAKAGDTIQLLSNVDISTTGLTIGVDRSVTLDLNGKELKATNTTTGNIQVNGALTLKDSSDTGKDGTGTGKLCTETPYAAGTAASGVVAVTGGSFTMESGYIETVIEDDPTNKGQFAVTLPSEDGGSVTINGGKIEAGWYAIAGNGNNVTTEAQITVNGGTLISTADYAIYHPHLGTLTVTGGVIYGQTGGIAMNRGTAKISGGTITSKGQGSTGSWGDGTGGLGNAALNVDAKYGDVAVTITDGTLIAEGDAVTVVTGDAHKAAVSISGGSFSSQVKPEHCAANYVPTPQQSNGMYTVATKRPSGGGSSGSSGSSGGGSSSKPNPSYSIAEGSVSDGGTVSVRTSSAKAGATVKVEVTPDKGKMTARLMVTDADGEPVRVTYAGDGVYTFVMPKGGVEVTAVFANAVADPADSGADRLLNTDDHFAFMQGDGNGSFRPDDPIRRSEAAQVFYNLLRDRTVAVTAQFDDVAPEAWYAEAVNTLASLEIIQGYQGRFDPERAITRAEFAAICARFARAVPGETEFPDVSASHWAYYEIMTAASYGWINGDGNGRFDPDRGITRAEAAAVVNRMLGRLGDWYAIETGAGARFPDVPASHWGWYDIKEAASSHDYTMDRERVQENWSDE